MTESKDERRPPRRLAEAKDERFCEALGGVLLRLLARKFAVPADDAESLVEEAFIGYQGLNPPPPDAEAWLIAAVCRGAKVYLQRRGLDADDDPRAAKESVFVDAAVRTLPERAREALRLRFDERMTYPEIAAELNISAFAAERIVAKAIAKIRKLQRERGAEWTR